MNKVSNEENLYVEFKSKRNEGIFIDYGQYKKRPMTRSEGNVMESKKHGGKIPVIETTESRQTKDMNSEGRVFRV